MSNELISLLLTFLTAGLLALINKYLPIGKIFPGKTSSQNLSEVNLPVEEKISTQEREKLQYELTNIAIDRVANLERQLKETHSLAERSQEALRVSQERNRKYLDRAEKAEKEAKEWRAKAEQAEIDNQNLRNRIDGPISE